MDISYLSVSLPILLIIGVAGFLFGFEDAEDDDDDILTNQLA
jgi:hypothetical protein